MAEGFSSLFDGPQDEDERYELYVLRRHFRISAIEAENGMPHWERVLLLEQLVKEDNSDNSDSTDAPLPDDPFGDVPEELERLEIG